MLTLFSFLSSVLVNCLFLSLLSSWSVDFWFSITFFFWYLQYHGPVKECNVKLLSYYNITITTKSTMALHIVRRYQKKNVIENQKSTDHDDNNDKKRQFTQTTATFFLKHDYYLDFVNRYTTVDTSWVRITYPSGIHEFISGFVQLWCWPFSVG
jgi:hypothetical protein